MPSLGLKYMVSGPGHNPRPGSAFPLPNCADWSAARIVELDDRKTTIWRSQAQESHLLASTCSAGNSVNGHTICASGEGRQPPACRSYISKSVVQSLISGGNSCAPMHAHARFCLDDLSLGNSQAVACDEDRPTHGRPVLGEYEAIGTGPAACRGNAAGPRHRSSHRCEDVAMVRPCRAGRTAGPISPCFTRAQDTLEFVALSRRKHGFESPRERQYFQYVIEKGGNWCPGCVPSSVAFDGAARCLLRPNFNPRLHSARQSRHPNTGRHPRRCCIRCRAGRSPSYSRRPIKPPR